MSLEGGIHRIFDIGSEKDIIGQVYPAVGRQQRCSFPVCITLHALIDPSVQHCGVGDNMRGIEEKYVSAEAMEESGRIGYEFYRQAVNIHVVLVCAHDVSSGCFPDDGRVEVAT